MAKFFVLTASVIIGAILYRKHSNTIPKVPRIQDKWFGKNEFGTDSPAIVGFAVNVSDRALEDLNQRLRSARFAKSIRGTNFEYGFHSDYLEKIVTYWLTEYDWRAQEKLINGFNHQKTQISGLDIHFIHEKPTKPADFVIPLMLIHGWPGSFWEYYKIIPMLTEPMDGLAFEVIVPSIPGYGFSAAPQQQGLDVTQTARIFKELMRRLKFDRFVVHGEDWGSLIGRCMAIFYPDNVRGLQLTLNVSPMSLSHALKMMVGAYIPSLVFDEPEVEYRKLYPLWQWVELFVRETGYFHFHVTKPDTVGASLVDSPVGLAAYLLERFAAATDRNYVDKEDGGLTDKFTMDELLTNVMIYWTSGNVASSLRLYKESVVRFVELRLADIAVPASVPSAVTDFPNEVIRSSQTLTRTQFENLVQFTDMPRGGHIPALEEPQLVSQDIRSFANKILTFERMNEYK